ncbi:uncharacterized protein [Euphorbia lathyris]|uniref:uncharacterized protein n=1 Tax=Euphorbia lathyris TaxID=212925 RepID=UPI00331310DC
MAFPNFNALRELHNSANDLLHSPEIQQVLGDQKQEKWVNEVSEASLKMLDVCGISKDVLSLVKEHLLDLQFKLMLVVEVIREVRVITLSTIESLLSLISIPWLDQKSAIKSKFFRSSGDFFDETALHSANKRLEAVEIAIEDLEMELECISRRLIQTRVSLLNILTN